MRNKITGHSHGRAVNAHKIDGRMIRQVARPQHRFTDLERTWCVQKRLAGLTPSEVVRMFFREFGKDVSVAAVRSWSKKAS